MPTAAAQPKFSRESTSPFSCLECMNNFKNITKIIMTPQIIWQKINVTMLGLMQPMGINKSAETIGTCSSPRRLAIKAENGAIKPA